MGIVSPGIVDYVAFSIPVVLESSILLFYPESDVPSVDMTRLLTPSLPWRSVGCCRPFINETQC